MRLFRKRPVRPAVAAERVYYSTPFGDTQDGQQKLFLLERDGNQYFPVFRSVESMREFYEQRNRAAYVVLEGDIPGVMNSVRSLELMKDVRMVIEPMSQHPVEIFPDA